MPTSAEQDILRKQKTRTTSLASEDIRDWNARIKAEALFSARTTSRAYVDMLKKRLMAVASREVNPQIAERQLQQCLDALGYSPQSGFPGDGGRVPPATPKSIRDLSSSHRIQLILDTGVKKARSMGQMAAGESPVFMRTNPAWRLERTGARKKPRGDWKRRWAAAGASVGWRGAAKRDFVALKTSPIWEALGNGTGGFKDALGSPFPPFAFGSGMAWTNVSRRDWERVCEREGMSSGLEDFDRQTRERHPLMPDAPETPPDGALAERLRKIRERIRAERERGDGAAGRGVSEPPKPAPKKDAAEAKKAVGKSLADIQAARSAISRRIRAVERVYAKAADLSRERFGGRDEALGRIDAAIAAYGEVARLMRDFDQRLAAYAAVLGGLGDTPNPAVADRYVKAAARTIERSEAAFQSAQRARTELADWMKRNPPPQT